MKNYTNKHGLPKPIFQALSADYYEQKKLPADIRAKRLYSATTLLRPSWQVALQKQLQEDRVQITLDISSEISKVKGQALHAIIERAAEGDPSSLVETAFWAEFPEGVITGFIDYYDAETNTLYDLKSTKAYSLGKAETISSWEAQLNIYRYLMGRGSGSFQVESLVVLVWIDGWMPSLAKQDPDYPQCQIVQVPVRVWTFEETEAFIRERIASHQKAEKTVKDPQAPGCSPEETWQTEAKFSVRKKGSSRALPGGNFSTPEGAELFMAGRKDRADLEIISQPAERIRCKDYCDLASNCRHYIDYVLGGKK